LSKNRSNVFRASNNHGEGHRKEKHYFVSVQNKLVLSGNISQDNSCLEIQEKLPWSSRDELSTFFLSATLASGGSVLPSSSKTTLVPTGLWTLIFNFFFFKTRVAGLQKQNQIPLLRIRKQRFNPIRFSLVR
jgi:hypothetical protein